MPQGIQHVLGLPGSAVSPSHPQLPAYTPRGTPACPQRSWRVAAAGEIRDAVSGTVAPKTFFYHRTFPLLLFLLLLKKKTLHFHH